LHRLTDNSTYLIHVTFPVQRRVVATDGVALHRSARAIAAVQGHTYPPRTRVEETVLDLTQAAATFDDVCGWVSRAIARDGRLAHPAEKQWKDKARDNAAAVGGL
jgi:hypothetical protein